MELKTIGSAARFFVMRYRRQTSIGPYVVTTAEVRPAAYETSVTWGEGGPQIESFGSGFSFDEGNAAAAHEEVCGAVEVDVGLQRASISDGLPPAA
ncbi:MAG TPA: hypothetical protein VII45_03925 [Solirubrobacterales bacterium]